MNKILPVLDFFNRFFNKIKMFNYYNKLTLNKDKQSKHIGITQKQYASVSP